MNERMKEIRKYSNMNQSEFGARLGVGKTAISKIENGDNNVTETMVKLICSEFDVDETWLRTGEGEMFPPRTQEETLSREFGKVIDLNDPVKKEVILMIVECLSTMSEEEWAPIKAHIQNIAALMEKK